MFIISNAARLFQAAQITNLTDIFRRYVDITPELTLDERIEVMIRSTTYSDEEIYNYLTEYLGPGVIFTYQHAYSP